MGSFENTTDQTRREFLGRFGSLAAFAGSDDSLRAPDSSLALSRAELLARRRGAFDLRLRRRAVWFQKGRVHRYLRPEEYGGRVHNQLVGAASYPLHGDVLNLDALARVFSANGSYLLPQAYPDGCPLHPAYPSGHSTGIGSTVTMLKVLFDESFVIPTPVEASPDGLSLVPYTGPPLTVGSELNKLAFNVGMGRLFAGIHFRSDVIWGNWLGEAVSLGLLADEAGCYNEPFSGYSLQRFDGSVVTIAP